MVTPRLGTPTQSQDIYFSQRSQGLRSHIIFRDIALKETTVTAGLRSQTRGLKIFCSQRSPGLIVRVRVLKLFLYTQENWFLSMCPISLYGSSLTSHKKSQEFLFLKLVFWIQIHNYTLKMEIINKRETVQILYLTSVSVAQRSLRYFIFVSYVFFFLTHETMQATVMHMTKRTAIMTTVAALYWAHVRRLNDHLSTHRISRLVNI